MEDLNPIKLFFNRLYYYFFVERFNEKLTIEFPKNIKRWDLIQNIIDKKKYDNYLEIGCDKDQSFSKIAVKNKVGVDPVSGGNIRSTSDQFFSKNKDNFDIIFIDGLHHYEQVIKDVNNSLKILNENGFILLHDCLPRSIAHQAIPRYRGSWNGDVWKALVELRTRSDLDTHTCQIDFGVGIVQKKKNTEILSVEIKNFKNLKFSDYYNNFNSYMRVIDYKKALELI